MKIPPFFQKKAKRRCEVVLMRIFLFPIICWNTALQSLPTLRCYIVSFCSYDVLLHL